MESVPAIGRLRLAVRSNRDHLAGKGAEFGGVVARQHFTAPADIGLQIVFAAMGGMMDLNRKYSDAELEKIVDEAAIYMCACPGQVASEIRQMRQLIRYQGECLVEARTPEAVHETIAASAQQAHAIMEACLDRVLELEGWDRTTLQMPPGLRKLRDEVIQRGT